jgi:hypothetical protein
LIYADPDPSFFLIEDPDQVPNPGFFDDQKVNEKMRKVVHNMSFKTAN